MFFRSSHQGRGNSIRSFCPRLGASPSVGAHQMSDGFTHSNRIWQGIGPRKVFHVGGSHGDQNKARTKLRNPVVGRVQQPPVRLISEFFELFHHLSTVRRKSRLGEASHVFQHDRFGTRPGYDFNSLREQVSFIISAKLLAGNRERGARDTPSNEVDTFKLGPIHVVQISLLDVPTLVLGHADTISVGAQGCAGPLVVLDRRQVGESCLLQAESLPSRSGAQFERSEGGRVFHDVLLGLARREQA